MRQISFLHYCLTQALLQPRWLPTETAAEDALQRSERVSLRCHLVSSSRNRLAASVLREDSTGDIRGGLGEQTLEALMSRGLESVSPGQLEPMTHALALLAVLHTCRASCGLGLQETRQQPAC